jgi:hypothetical protein
MFARDELAGKRTRTIGQAFSNKHIQLDAAASGIR